MEHDFAACVCINCVWLLKQTSNYIHLSAIVCNMIGQQAEPRPQYATVIPLRCDLNFKFVKFWQCDMLKA